MLSRQAPVTQLPHQPAGTGQHQEVPHSLHQGADWEVGEGVHEGKLYFKTKKMRASKRVEFTRKYNKGENLIIINQFYCFES